MSVQIITGDCLEVLRTLPDCSVDSVVTDPPYGLSFMGKKWDYDVPSIEVWAECLRVLKPGGHLLAFAGTRTQHRMAVRIEDAGFEIRDLIAWVYGSGFPKSLDVSKAIDAQDAAQARLEVAITTAHTDAARQWQGWGTALKPALETVTFASKPYTAEQERDIILSNLIRLEARLWLLSSASAVEKSSTSSQSEYGAACAIAQWGADEITSTQAALCDPMGTSLFELATTTSLNIVSSWRRTLVESWSDGNTSTTETKSSTTTDWRTLKFSLSQITPASIIKACSLPGGFSANATTAESHFNASLSLLQSIHTLSATERAMSQAQHEHQDAGVKPNLDPCIMARKPLIGTVAENVLRHGTGALNVDGCRVGMSSEDAAAINAKHAGMNAATYQRPAGVSLNLSQNPMALKPANAHEAGRWPANLIHDGSEEVVAAFPQEITKSSGGKSSKGGMGKRVLGVYALDRTGQNTGGLGDNGTPARFFYCAKASKRDRDEGLEGFAKTSGGMVSNTSAQHMTRRDEGYEVAPRANNHPTVKPTDLMRYLCRLVTPPGGVVLDPFMGSGSTGKAAVLEGFRFIGIEREAEYVEIARARIAAAQAGAEKAAEPSRQPDLFGSAA
ncbi:DNA methylase [Cylindrospermopsis phage Cr-LKS3]|nr:DNA methylase [Cylindrospermopsis phage Cr-LKS3]